MISALKISLIILAGAICLGRSAFAASSSTNAGATVKVASVFSLSVDSSSVDFGSQKPGEWKEITNALGYSNAIVCKSNTGNAWSLKIKANGPLSFGSNNISAASLKWMSTYAGSKNVPYTDLSQGLMYKAADGYRSFPLSDETIYASQISDYSNLPNGTEIQLKYGLLVPDNPSPGAGIYSTSVTFTLTE